MAGGPQSAPTPARGNWEGRPDRREMGPFVGSGQKRRRAFAEAWPEANWDEYSETDVEEALIRHLETFLLELRGDFTFIDRQRRLRVGAAWYRVDLLFFHPRLRCLVVIDLKSESSLTLT